MTPETDIPKTPIDNDLERIANHPNTPEWVGRFATGLVTARRIARTPTFRLRQKAEGLEARAKAWEEKQDVRLQKEIERFYGQSEK